MMTPQSSPVPGPAKSSARIFVLSGPWIRSISTGPSPFRASEGLRTDLHQRAQTPQVVGRRLPVQMQRRPVQADRAQRLAAHLLRAGVDGLHAGPCLGNAPVASLLTVRQRLASLALALDMQVPALGRQALLALAVDLALVGVDIAAGVAGAEHALEEQGVVLAGRAHLHAANQLVPLVHARGQLIAEVALTVLLAPARLHVLLSALRRRPLGRHGIVLHDLLLVTRELLLRRRHDARVDHLPAPRDVALAVELPVHRVEDPLGGAHLDQPILEGTEGRAVGCLRTLPQPHEALEAPPVQKLELHLLVAEVVELLDHQNPNHQLGRERRPSITFASGPGRCLVDSARPAWSARHRSSPASSHALAPRTD